MNLSLSKIKIERNWWHQVHLGRLLTTHKTNCNLKYYVSFQRFNWHGNCFSLNSKPVLRTGSWAPNVMKSWRLLWSKTSNISYFCISALLRCVKGSASGTVKSWIIRRLHKKFSSQKAGKILGLNTQCKNIIWKFWAFLGISKCLKPSSIDRRLRCSKRLLHCKVLAEARSHMHGSCKFIYRRPTSVGLINVGGNKTFIGFLLTDCYCSTL